ncbi:MAG: hypothetical protein WBD24_03595 [Candidatus Omnitrophota bacterium]
MKKIIIAVIVCLLLSGQIAVFAESKPTYLNPKSRAYHKPMLGAICDRCYSTFMVSGYQLENEETGICPYCGEKQNLKDACNRFTHSELIIQEHTSRKK